MLWGTPVLHAMENPFFKPFPFEEGVVYYAVRGSRSGSRTLYFRKFGRERLIVEKVSGSVLDGTKPLERVTLINADGKYIIDSDREHARKVPLLNQIVFEKFQKLTKEDQKKVLENLKKSSDRSFAAVGTPCSAHAKEIIGIACTQEQIEGVRTCSAAGGALLLEASVTLLGYHTYTFATAYRKEKLDAALFFTLPESIEVTSKSDALDRQAQRVIDTLLHHPDICREPRHAASEDLHQHMFEEIRNLSRQF